jgi:hypothetical protein
MLQCGRMNQHVGSSFKMRWLLQTGCAQSARLLFAAPVRKQAGSANPSSAVHPDGEKLSEESVFLTGRVS